MFLISCLACGVLDSLKAQVNVGVAIGIQDRKCGSDTYYSHIGVAWWYGDDSYSVLEEKAKADVRANYPAHNRITTRWGKGNHLVIISTNKQYQNCARATIGVGIGMDKNEALEKAIQGINGTNWSWSPKDGYDVIVDRSF